MYYSVFLKSGNNRIHGITNILTMEHQKINNGNSLIRQERRYIRIDNRICFLDDNYYEKVFCKTGSCWWVRLVLIFLMIGIFALIGLAQTGCPAGQSPVEMYRGYGSSSTDNGQVNNAGLTLGYSDGTFAVIKRGNSPASRGVINVRLSDNVVADDTIWFYAAGAGNPSNIVISVSADGLTYSGISNRTLTNTSISRYYYVVGIAGGANYFRMAVTDNTNDARLDAVEYKKLQCYTYCLPSFITYTNGTSVSALASSTATNPGNANGIPDASLCVIDGGSGQTLFLDLGRLLPAHSIIQLFLTNDAATAANFSVSGSADNISYTGIQTFTGAHQKPIITQYLYTISQLGGIRYLKITVSNNARGDVDAVVYKYADFMGRNYISGRLYMDANNSGTKDLGEVGISGISLQMFHDVNGNSALDPGDPVIQTETSVSDGEYFFAADPLNNLNDYAITVVPSTLPAGMALTTANFQFVHFNPGTVNEMACSNDFGYHNCGSICSPIAYDDFVTTTQGASVPVTVLANDYDPNNNIDSASLHVLVYPQNGSFVIQNGTIIYLPNGSFSGSDDFTYRICDKTGLCDTASVDIFVTLVQAAPCSDAVHDHTFFIPFPEQQARIALGQCQGSGTLGDSCRTIISIKCPYPGTILYYDHWEDGYEHSVTNPQSATTLVWGDGNIYNGIAPGYATDFIPSGGSIVLDNTIYYTVRNPLNIKYDGRDKLFSTSNVAVSRVGWDKDRGPVQAISVDVYDVNRFGTSFVVPMGQNLSPNVHDFDYMSVFVRAAFNNTPLQIDVNGDGNAEVSNVLNEGDVYFVDGGINAGAMITAGKPVGVDLFFGDKLRNFNAKQMNLIPMSSLTDTYFTPVSTTHSPDTSVIYFYNILNRNIIINWETQASSGSFVLLPKVAKRFPLSILSGYKFGSAGGETFVCNQICDAWTPGAVNGGENDGSTYDWAFNPLPSGGLTNFLAVAWAPGWDFVSGGATAGLEGNPVWITSDAATTIYIKRDGNIMSGGVGTSPCGFMYDIAVPLAKLEMYRLFNTLTHDNSGVAIYTCNGAKIAGAYGEDPANSEPGNPYLDVGTSIQPLCFDRLIFANDDMSWTVLGTPVNIQILNNDFPFLCAINPSSVTTSGLKQPSHGTAVVNPDGSITYTPNYGWLGVDTLEYEVCSMPVTVVCDRAYVIVYTGFCPPGMSNIVVAGQVFADLNKDGHNNDGHAGFSGAEVSLYLDNNCNGTADGIDNLLDSVIVNNSGSFNFTQLPEFTIIDDFDGPGGVSSCNGGNDGSGRWLTRWTDSEGDSLCAGTRVLTVMDQGDNSLRIARRQRWAMRSINLGGANQAFLSFRVRRGAMATDRYLSVQLSADGNNWTSIHTVFGNVNADAAYINVDNLSIPAGFLLPSTGNNIRLRFFNANINDDELFFIDNIKINFLKFPLCLITMLDNATVPAGYHSTTSVSYAFTANTAGCYSSNDFGVALDNEPPVAVPDTFRILMNQTLHGQVLLNDVEPDGDVMSVSLVSSPSSGFLTLNSDGTFTFIPAAGFTGLVTFVYRNCDNHNHCSAAMVSIEVLPCILPPVVPAGISLSP
jgi:hypothetical protein